MKERHIIRKCIKTMLKDWRIVPILALLLIPPCMMLLGIILQIKDYNHYLRIKDNAIEVTATVTYHGTRTDSDEEDYYISGISYTVDGIEYKNIQFEKSYRYSELTEIGEQVTVKVSPENPRILMKDLKSSVFLIWVLVVILVSMFAVPWINFKCRR